MGIVDTLSELFTGNKKREAEQSSFLEANSNAIKEFLITANNLGNSYIKSSELKIIKEKYNGLYEICRQKRYKKISNQDFVEFVNIYSNLDSFINEKNEIFIKKEILENKSLLDNIDGKSLDNQQRNAVAINNDANIIIAGAGSGKTLTIAAKVKYLVDSKGIDPAKILLISFTNKAAAEMQERITKKLNISVESKTFHKLGLDIISKAQGYKPAVYSDLPKQIVDYFEKELIKDKSRLSDMLLFFGLYLEVPKPRDGFKTMGEQIDYDRSCDLETIKGKINNKATTLKMEKKTLNNEQVKSIEELLIANFLFLNGVEYTYEKPYEYKVQGSEKRQYQPDFYLEEYGIYLEHFGITKDNKVPWLDPIEEEKYLDGIEWKRETHKNNNTTLIETYSYYNTEGRLLEELDRILKNNGIKYKSVDYEGIYKKLLMKDDKKFIEFRKLVNTFINLCKSNKSTPSDSSLINDLRMGRNQYEIKRATLFLKIVNPIFEYYQTWLRLNGALDFNDMINLATDLVKNKKVVFDYEHIIIDEYQDISKGRFNLINEIRSQSDAIVTAVGDDWQSIFRFAGSDLHLFTKLDHYFGTYSKTKIERTYRNSQELIDIAGQFVMKNPEQIKKNLKSEIHHTNPLRFIGYEQSIDEAMRIAIEEIVNSEGAGSEVMILGRNNFDIDLLNHTSLISIKQISGDEIKIASLKYPKLTIKYLTVHKSKGLESDNVILINLENKQIGFPNKIADDPILSLMLASNEEYEFAEERRLFYVALTRTKNRTYLLVPENNKSIFAKELIDLYKIKHSVTYNNELNSEKTICPKCKTGHLVIRKDSKNKQFLGCSNYPLCDNSYKEVELLANPLKCNDCGGFMVKRKGKYGEFIGCTNFPFCKNKITFEK